MPMMSSIKHAMKNARIRPPLGRVSQLTDCRSRTPLFELIVRHWLDNHARAIPFQRLPNVRCRSGGVGPVVQAVEERDQIEIPLRILFGRRDLEAVFAVTPCSRACAAACSIEFGSKSYPTNCECGK